MKLQITSAYKQDIEGNGVRKWEMLHLQAREVDKIAQVRFVKCLFAESLDLKL
jgi:hypothetical protein